jgi:hypothetical protein
MTSILLSRSRTLKTPKNQVSFVIPNSLPLLPHTRTHTHAHTHADSADEGHRPRGSIPHRQFLSLQPRVVVQNAKGAQVRSRSEMGLAHRHCRLAVSLCCEGNPLSLLLSLSLCLPLSLSTSYCMCDIGGKGEFLSFAEFVVAPPVEPTTTNNNNANVAPPPPPTAPPPAPPAGTAQLLGNVVAIFHPHVKDVKDLQDKLKLMGGNFLPYKQTKVVSRVSSFVGGSVSDSATCGKPEAVVTHCIINPSDAASIKTKMGAVAVVSGEWIRECFLHGARVSEDCFNARQKVLPLLLLSIDRARQPNPQNPKRKSIPCWL